MRSALRSALLVPALLLAAGVPLLVGCGGGDEAAEKTSETRPDADGEAGTSGEDPAGGEEGDGDEEGNGDEDAGGSSEDESTSIPDLDDLTESIPGLGELGDCMEIAAAYGSLYFEALGGADGAEQAQEKAEELKSVLPEDLHDDIDIVAETIGQVAEEGLFSGSDALSSPEYLEADQAITAYLDEQCGGGTGDGGA
jgi:hypothetical protein